MGTLPLVHRKSATEGGCTHGGRCHSMPYHVGLQVSRGIYPKISAEGAALWALPLPQRVSKKPPAFPLPPFVKGG